MQLHGLEPHLNAVASGAVRKRATGGKKGELPVALRPFIKRLDEMTPSLALTVVDLAQVQDLPLHHPAARAALVLDNIPVAMLLAILEASVVSQEHDANQPTSNPKIAKDTWSTLQTIYNRAPLIRLTNTPSPAQKSLLSGAS
jgi:hypothetical protein